MYIIIFSLAELAFKKQSAPKVSLQICHKGQGKNLGVCFQDAKMLL